MTGTLISVLVLGIGATLVSDIWQKLFLKLLDGSSPNWSTVGRWVLGFHEGRFVDHEIRKRAPFEGENVFGWGVHYVVGLAYAAIYLACLMLMASPVNLWNAVAFGLVTLAAPMLVMKPAMGGGFFGMRASNPMKGFTKTLSAHLSFGIGLWIASLAL